MASLAERITRAASRQTYYTIRLLADRGRVQEAFRAYAYFRWVDDTLDGDCRFPLECLDFLHRQDALLAACYRGEAHEAITPEEQLLVDLVRSDSARDSGLQTYLRGMMRVMEFDTGRRGRLITQAELDNYTRMLSVAVTEAMHYFVGHGEPAPHDETRYLAVTGAHIAHMLRDTQEDLEHGYFNVPRELLERERITPADIESAPYREWVRGRVLQARQSLARGKDYYARVRSDRHRLVALAYVARFEWVLDTIEADGFHLRHDYKARKGVGAALRIAALTLASLRTSLRRRQEQRGPVSRRLDRA